MFLHIYCPQRSWNKVMFSQTCVILFTVGGVSASVHAEIHPREQTPPPPRADTPQEQTPPEQIPPRADTPQCRACWEIRSTRGRYATYWNAILLILTPYGKCYSSIGTLNLISEQKQLTFSCKCNIFEPLMKIVLTLNRMVALVRSLIH